MFCSPWQYCIMNVCVLSSVCEYTRMVESLLEPRCSKKSFTQKSSQADKLSSTSVIRSERRQVYCSTVSTFTLRGAPFSSMVGGNSVAAYSRSFSFAVIYTKRDQICIRCK